MCTGQHHADLDHTDDATYGQQALSFYNHNYGHYCYLPLLVFEANSSALVTAVLRHGKRPTGAENAMIMKRVLSLLRSRWPQTHILLRGDGHFSNPELMRLLISMSLSGGSPISFKPRGQS